MESLRCEVWCYYIFVPEELSSLQKSLHQGDLPFWAEQKQKLLLNVTKLSFFLCFLHSDDKHYARRMYSRFNVWTMLVLQYLKRILIIVMVAIQGKWAQISHTSRNKE